MTTRVHAPCVILTNFRYLVYRETQSVLLWFTSHIYVLMVLLYCSVWWGHTFFLSPSCIISACHISPCCCWWKLGLVLPLSTVNTALKISAWDPVDSVVRYYRLNWWFYFKHLKCLHPALYRGRTIYSPQNVQDSTLYKFYQHNILFCLIVAITMMCRYLPEVLLCKYQMFSGPKSKSKFIEYIYNCLLDMCLSFLRKCPPQSFICYVLNF